MGVSVVEYPFHFPEFPSYLKAYIQHSLSERMSDEGGFIRVVVKSQIHKTKEATLPTSVTKAYYDKYPNRFRSEIKHAIIQRYGLKIEPERWM
jgi:hypothetical protein